MRNKIIKILELVLVIVSLIAIVLVKDISVLTKCYLVIGAVIITFILKALYHFFIKKRKLAFIKINKVILTIALLIFITSLFIISYKELLEFNTNSLIILANIFAIILGLLTTFQYCKKVLDVRFANINAFLAFILYIIIFIECKSMIELLIFPLPLISLYLLEGFDYTAIYRKKNIIKISIVAISLFIMGLINPICILLIIPIFYSLLTNAKLKKTIYYIMEILLCTLAGNMVNILFINANIIAYSNSYLDLIFFGVLLVTLIIIFINNVKNSNNFRKYSFFLLPYLLILLLSKSNVVYLVNAIPIMITIITLSLPLNLLEHFSVAKYFVDKKNIKKVSVVIPNYNYANYIEERIDSVLKQNYPIYELIILDDKSTDNSEEVILKKVQKIKEKYKSVKIEYIPNELNSGNVFKQWEKSFKVASGDYLWIAEADDLCSKYFLNAVMKAFDDEKVVLSYAESNAINEYGEVFKKDLRDWIDIYNTGKWNRSYIVDGKEELKTTMCINNTLGNVSSAVFKLDKKIPFAKFLKTSQSYILAGDWYFYSKVLLYGKVAYHDEALNYHRIHTNSVTNTTDNFIHYKEIEKIQNSIMKDVKVPAKTKKMVQNRKERLQRDLIISPDELKYDKVSLEKLIKKNKIEDEVLLSIIIPVYNVEKYLEKCLKSIFKDLPIKTEVIIINDGSPDNSDKIIQKYASLHKEIKYIKKKNGGLSSVKNVGLKEAKGKYIIFLDSDDYVSSNMYNTMLKKAIDTNSDLVYCDVLMTFEDGKVRYCSMTNYEYKDEILRILNNNLMAASWNKMVKRELYNGLKFPEGYNNEDVAISPLIILKAKKITNIPSPFYKYVQRSGSIQNSGFNEKRFVIFDTVKMCFDSIKEYDLKTQKKVQGAILTHQILALLIYPMKEIEDKDELRKLTKIFVEKYNNLDIIEDNDLIKSFLKTYDKPKLTQYIKEEKIEEIIKYIK